MQKQHFYNITFVDSHPNGLQYGNCYMGYDEQEVTLARIAQARVHAQVSSNATLVDCSYLGYMTPAEFKAQ